MGSRIIKPGPSFSPRQLFARGRQGVWCEPGPTQCFTDTSGTTPATAGQAVAKNTELSAGRSVIQATAANRPTLSAQYTLLLYSENYATWWNRLRSVYDPALQTVSQQSGQTNGGGIQTPDLKSLLINGAEYVLSCRVKNKEKTWCRLAEFLNSSTLGNTWFDLDHGSVGTVNANHKNPTISSIGNGYYSISITVQYRDSGQAPSVLLYLADQNSSSTVTDSGGIYVNGMDLRLATTPAALPKYQRIAAATDYDTTGFPWRLVHDSADYLTATLPALSGGNYSTAASVYFGTPQGMSSIHSQSIGTTYNLPAPNTDVYGCMIVPSRLSPPEEEQLARYFRAKAGIVGSEAFLYESGYGFLTADDGKYRLLRR